MTGLQRKSIKYPCAPCRWVLIGFVVALVGGCTDPDEGTSSTDMPTPTVQEAGPVIEEAGPAIEEAASPDEDNTPTPAEPAPVATSKSFASIVVVDLEGQPLPGMTPIVTRQPNAFDEPVASGISTDQGGHGSIRFETGEHLYLRAWDPALQYFPNNFYEVLPGGSTVQGELTIQMVPSASLEAQFFLPVGEPAREETVALMLFHPTRGPWWPAEAKTDAEGVARFSNVPPGEFVLRFKSESGPRLEHPQTALPPATAVNLGALSLQAP